MNLPQKFAIADYHAARNWAHAVVFWVSIPDRCYFYTVGRAQNGEMYNPGRLSLRFEPPLQSSLLELQAGHRATREWEYKMVTNGVIRYKEEFRILTAKRDYEYVRFDKGTAVRFSGGMYLDPVTHDVDSVGWEGVDIPKMFDRTEYVRHILSDEHLQWLGAAYPSLSVSCVKARLWATFAYSDMGSRSSLTKRRINALLKEGNWASSTKIKESLRRAFNWFEKPSKTPTSKIRMFLARRMRKHADVGEATLRLFRLIGATSKITISKHKLP